MLAADAAAGDDFIVVQTRQLVLRGAFIRIGAEIPDLLEERMVVKVTSDEHSPGLTKLCVGVSLRFFHPAKALVSTVLSPPELAKCLAVSDTQTMVREIIVDIALGSVEKASIPMEKFPTVSNLGTALVTSFEPIHMLPIASSSLQLGPSMRYLAACTNDPSSTGVSILNDELSICKLQAYWEGILVQTGKNVRLSPHDIKQIVRRNAYLSLLRSETEETELMTFEEFQTTFRLPQRFLLNFNEENEARVKVPLTFLRRHFTNLLETSTTFTKGYKSAQASALLRRVYKDVQDHIVTVSEDVHIDMEELEGTLNVCQDLERVFVDSQHSALLSWPDIEYFVRHTKRLSTPEMFPAPLDRVRVIGSGQVAEVASGSHTSRLAILYFDGRMEIWNLSSNGSVLESKANVLFSTKNTTDKCESSGNNFMRAWIDANRLESSDTSSRLRRFKRRTEASGALVTFCAWDSVICINSSILQESGSGTFRFFRLANNCVCPIRQVAVKSVEVKLPSLRDKKQSDTVSSSGIVTYFKVAVDGSKIVFLTGCERILWLACAGSGEILCHINLQVTQTSNYRLLFQIVDTQLPSGEFRTQLYATISAKSYRHVGMWILPQGSRADEALERKRVFTFGDTKTSTTVHLAVCAALLFVASRDGAIIVWSTANDQNSSISPLVCLRIPLHNEELQSLSCQTLGDGYSEAKSSMIQVTVLQPLHPHSLKFALYLFDDGEIIRLQVAENFDLRLVTLEDSAFEFDTFLMPTSGVEQNPARRVVLQKHRIIRVLLVALHPSRSGIFAQKSVNNFFKDLENHGILWKTRDEIVKFAASYHENVAIQLQMFYRHGDDEQVELTQPQCLKQENNANETQVAPPVVVVGAVVKSRATDQTQCQIWKFALNYLRGSEFESEQHQLDHARRALSVQSSYRLEADRVHRFREDFSRKERVRVQGNKCFKLVQNVKDNIREIIAQGGSLDDTTDSLLRGINSLMLANFESQIHVDPVGNFFLKLLSQVPSSEFSSLIELIKREQSGCVCFAAWIDRVLKEVAAAEELNREQGITLDRLGLIVRHVEATSVTTAELGALFVDLGLINASDRNAFPRLVDQLHRFVRSTRPDDTLLTLEATTDALYSSLFVAEFIVECTHFLGFFDSKMSRLCSYVTELLESDQSQPEASYAMQLKTRKWQTELRQLAQRQNALQIDTFRNADVDVLQPTVEDLQQLQRFLNTPLPSVALKVSSITLENRCDSIRSRDRFAMNASGRVEDHEDCVPLAVLCVIMDGDEEAGNSFKQELLFLRKLQHVRARDFFLPVCLDAMNAPIFPTANGSLVCGGDSDEIRCVVVESLTGWTSLAECLEIIRLSPSSVAYWTPLLWSWSLRVLMALLAMHSQRFSVRGNVNLDMILVSPDSCDLRWCSLSGGAFRESADDDRIDREMAQTLGVFVRTLLHRIEDNVESTVDTVGRDLDNETLCNMRRQLLRLVASKSDKLEGLTDFSSVSQIIACGVGTRDGETLEKLCALGLLCLQPANSRPGILSLWTFVGRPGIEVLSNESQVLNTLSKHLMTLVELERRLRKLSQDLRVCVEECDDESCNKNTLLHVVKNWTVLLERFFQLKTSKKDSPGTRIFATTLGHLVDNRVPYQLCAISLQIFTQSLKHGNRDNGHKAVDMLLHSFADALELVETNTDFNELQSHSILMATVQQILECVVSRASGQVPPNVLNETSLDAAENAVLWRLSEPLFRNLLGIEMRASKYATLLQWLDSRRPPFGYTIVENDASSGPSDETNLWWGDHDPRMPRHTPSSLAEEELMKSGCTIATPMTAKYLRCVYETKEIEFKLTSGVSVPKFRLAALQQLFGPAFFERKRSFPMVFLRSLVANVWKDLRFERLLCALLRDSDEKIVLGALSLLDCSTRIFRFDPLRSSNSAVYSFSCPERVFALRLCTQSVVIEVKRVLDTAIKMLKVLGESGASSASRSQHPLVAILCVGMSWLVNCLYGGDHTTQFWRVAGVDHLIIANGNSNSLPFLKVKDANMMNQVFHKAQRLGQDTCAKWGVFTTMPSSLCRNCSPFRLLLEEVVCVASNRAVGLMRALLLSRTFREEAVDSTVALRDLTFQRDLISSSDYGKVSHAIALARDITQLNGTINEQVQVILYVKTLFSYHAATSARVRVSAFVPVCKDIWGWMETAWRTVTLHSSSADKREKISRRQGDVVTAGFSLLHSIISHPALSVEDIGELTAFKAEDSGEPVNVLQELICWMTNLANAARCNGNTTETLIENGVELLTNVVQLRTYDEVAFATLNTCVDIGKVLNLLANNSSENGEWNTILNIEEKQKLWSMLLYFDSRVVTSRILDMDFLGSVVLPRLLSLNTHSSETQIASLLQRLEAVMFLEVLVAAASRCETSVNIQMLFAELFRLLLHHDIVAKEAAFLRKLNHSSNLSRKHVAVCKRVMQVVCCICVDFSAQSPSRIFLDKLEAVGVPTWVVAFHQARETRPGNSEPRVDVFWKEWHGKATKASEPIKLVHRSSETASRHRIQKQPSVKVGTMRSDEDKGKLKRSLVSVSPVKVADLAESQTSTRAKKNPSVIQTRLNFDAESALHLVKRSTQNGRDKRRDATDDEALDSDAYSPFPERSTSQEENRKFSRRSSAKRKPLENKSAKEGKRKRDLESNSSDGGLSASCNRPRKPRQGREIAKKNSKPQNEALRVIFKKYDVDGDGAISFIDLRRAMDGQMARQSRRLSDLEIQRWIADKDRSGQGVVSFEDFAVAFQRQVSL